VLNAIIETQTISLLLGKPVAVLASREIDRSQLESPRFWWIGEHNHARLDYVYIGGDRRQHRSQVMRVGRLGTVVRTDFQSQCGQSDP
jgi:hypothetical protein